MKTRVILGVAGLAGAAIAVGQLSAQNDASHRLQPGGNATLTNGVPQTESQGGGGPDVYVFKISGIENWSSGSFRAYSVGTTSCNEGTSPLSWQSNTNQHPVIAQNMFRWMPDAEGRGRFEQLGQSWLKHGFCALDLTECGACQGTGCSSLGVNCSDPYTAARNGNQGSAGPKYQVNASTGFFPYPPADPSYSGSTARRLQVAMSDVTGVHPDSRFWFEGQYVHPQDSPEDGNDSLDNVSYREVLLNGSGSATGYAGSTVQRQPAISAWRNADPLARIVSRVVAGEGRFMLGYRVWDNGDGTWDYEYAVYNQDSDRSVGEFAVPIPAGVNVTNIGFHDVDYHSNDGLSGNYDGTDWVGTVAGGEIRWTTAQSHAENANGNAIRWGTMYNFRFTADSGPQNGNTAEMAYFKPGTPTTETFTGVMTPMEVAIECVGDIDDSGAVDFNDLVSMLSAWGPCPGCAADLDGNDEVDFNDVVTLLSAWGACP